MTEPDLERCRAFIERATWTFAASMPQVPHEYEVRKRWVAGGGSDSEFSWFIAHIRQAGYWARWGRRRGKYLNVGPHHFWTLGWPVEATLVINRARADDPRSRPEHVGELRPCEGVTKQGRQCRNLAEEPNRYCSVHQHLEATEPELLKQLELELDEPRLMKFGDQVVAVDPATTKRPEDA